MRLKLLLFILLTFSSYALFAQTENIVAPLKTNNSNQLQNNKKLIDANKQNMYQKTLTPESLLDDSESRFSHRSGAANFVRHVKSQKSFQDSIKEVGLQRTKDNITHTDTRPSDISPSYAYRFLVVNPYNGFGAASGCGIKIFNENVNEKRRLAKEKALEIYGERQFFEVRDYENTLDLRPDSDAVNPQWQQQPQKELDE